MVDAAPAQFAQSWSTLARVGSGEQLIRIVYGLVERDATFRYQWGLSAFADNRLSTGFGTCNRVIGESRKRDFSESNWLAGESHYKSDLSRAVKSLVRDELPRSSRMQTLSGPIFARQTRRELM